jgi:hypothetical protein
VAAVAGFAAAAGPAPANTQGTAALRLVDQNPVTLRGSGFKRRERVSISAASGGPRLVRVVRATAAGTFTVVFTQLRFDPCDLEARAVGGSGSRAVLKLPERMCPLPLSPAQP